jgi:hypothetical protein
VIPEVQLETGIKTRDLVAQKVGFGCGSTYRQAKKAVENG